MREQAANVARSNLINVENFRAFDLVGEDKNLSGGVPELSHGECA